MAGTIQAIVGTAIYNLNDGNPFRLERAEGVGLAPVRRVISSRPFGDGDRDLGHRLDPRTSTLALNYTATSGSALDTHRDTLMRIFRPQGTVPVQLRLTRDDGQIRQLDTYTVGPVDVPLVKEHVPGNLQRAVVQLQAADPAWYDPTPGSAVVTGTPSLSPNWWLAGGVIGSAQVLEYGGTPAQGQAWTWAGTVATTSSWTIAIRTGQEGLTGTKYAFAANDYVSFATMDVVAGSVTTTEYQVNSVRLRRDTITSGTQTYFLSYRYNPYGAFIPHLETRQTLYRRRLYETDYNYNTESFHINHLSDGTVELRGTGGRWRSNLTGTAQYWSGAIPQYAIYSPALTMGQMSALLPYIEALNGGTVTQTVAVPYVGNLSEYPIIEVRGPISALSVVNSSTGERLSFGTAVVADGDTYTIDLRRGYKRVIDNYGVQHNDKLSSDSDLGTFHLAPAPLALGGTNTIAVYGSAVSSSTRIVVRYYNRYSEF